VANQVQAIDWSVLGQKLIQLAGPIALQLFQELLNQLTRQTAPRGAGPLAGGDPQLLEEQRNALVAALAANLALSKDNDTVKV